MYYRTKFFVASSIDVGFTIENLETGETVYFQPGDDTIQAEKELEQIENASACVRDNIFNSWCDAHFS